MKKILYFGLTALALVVLATPPPVSAAKDISGLAPWSWTQSADGLTTTTVVHAPQIMASTTAWAQGLFVQALPYIYLPLGVVVALSVILLLRRSIARLVRGATGSRRRGRRRR